MEKMMLMTTADAAFFLQASEGDVRYWINRGDLNAVKVGSRWRLEPTQVLDLVPLAIAADVLQVHKKTVCRWLHTGELAGRKLGRHWFVSRSCPAMAAADWTKATA